MQTEIILQDLPFLIQQETEKLSAELGKTLSFREFEDAVMKLMYQIEAKIIETELENLLTSPNFLKRLKVLGGKLGMRFQEYRPLHIRLRNGLKIAISSPYFLKSKAKRGRKKKGPNRRGKHLGLALLGILGKVSPAFLSKTVQLSLLCPSFAVAKSVLSEQGIEIDVKTLRRLCKVAGVEGMKWRGQVSLAGTEKLEGSTIVIGIDGGRLRERKGKLGRWKKGQKRQGFTTEWREPKLFTIYFLDAQGEVIRELAPFHDATMKGHKAVFVLLEQYLSALPLEQAEAIVFCGDGAPWIWSDVLSLCERMQLDMSKVSQVLDYTHAKQQLGKLLDYVGKPNGDKRKKGRLDTMWKEMLWHGQIDELKAEIKKHCVGARKVAALKKWKMYFKKNQNRMQYQTLNEQNLPCGSGSVESAIRRVINLRLKAAGTFWKSERAEIFLFLRSQLISGRWSIMMRNLTRQIARIFHRINNDKLDVMQFQQALSYTEKTNFE